MISIFLNIAIIVSFCVYWCINEKIGLQFSIVILLSAWAIHLLNYLKIDFLIKIHFEWFIIALFFCGYIALRKILEALLLKGGFRAYMITAAVVSFSLIIYHPLVNFIIPGGTLFGLGIGYCLNKKYVSFNSVDILQRKGITKYLTLLARIAIGVVILRFMVFRVEKIIFGMNENQNVFLYGFLCYTLIGFWVTIAAPWLFIKLRLAGTISDNDSSDAEKNSGHKYGKHWFSN